MLKEDLSIIMVGKLSKAALTQLAYYKSIASCVISCWDNDNLNLLNDYDLKDVQLVVNPSNAIPEHAGPGTIYFQVTTAKAAMQLVKTKFTIKTRLDESFSNLDPLIKLMEASPEKIVAGSVSFSKNGDAEPYHAGDHFYGSKSDTMQKALTLLKLSLEEKLPEGGLFNSDKFVKIDRIEQYLTRAFLYSNGETSFTKEIEKEVMKRNYEICRIRHLGSVHDTNTHGFGTVFFPNGSIPDTLDQTPNFETMQDY
jgi:hypothetical protein